jgi:hypothetical protein
MKLHLLPALALAGLLTGCGAGSDDSTVTPAPTPQPQAQALDVSQNATVTPPPGDMAPPPVNTVAPATQLTESEPLGGKGRPLTQEEVMLLNYGISMFKEEKGRFPADLQEAVASRHITRLPQLPPGEKFAYNAQNGTVKVETTN